MATYDAGRAKVCTIYRNGDDKFTGKRFVINKRKVKTLDALLQTVTVECKARTAVRHLATPIGGTRIRDLEDIQDHANLVAVGAGPFRKIGYTEIENHVKPRPSPRQNLIDPTFGEAATIQPVHHSRRYEVYSGRYRKVPTGALTIFIYSNGQEYESAHRFTFTEVQKQRMDWIKFLDNVTERNILRFGACKSIYKIPDEGSGAWEKVTSIQQFDTGKYYVAVGAESSGLKRLNYGQHVRPSFQTSPKLNRRKIGLESPNSFTKTNTLSRKSRASDNSNGPRLYPPKQKFKAEEDRFHGKPKQKPVRHNHTPVDYDKDEGGVYKARGARKETSGARPVEDSNDTKVDLPVDLRQAEQVQDEEIVSDGRKSRQSRSPSPHLTYRKSPEPIVMMSDGSRSNSKLKSRSRQRTRTPTPDHEMKEEENVEERVQTPQEEENIEERVQTPQEVTPNQFEYIDEVRGRESETGETSREEEKEERAQSPQEVTNDQSEQFEETQDQKPGDSNRDEEERRNSAAKRIQTNFRGYKARRQVEEIRKERGREAGDEAAEINTNENNDNQSNAEIQPENIDEVTKDEKEEEKAASPNQIENQNEAENQNEVENQNEAENQNEVENQNEAENQNEVENQNEAGKQNDDVNNIENQSNGQEDIANENQSNADNNENEAEKQNEAENQNETDQSNERQDESGDAPEPVASNNANEEAPAPEPANEKAEEEDTPPEPENEDEQ